MLPGLASVYLGMATTRMPELSRQNTRVRAAAIDADAVREELRRIIESRHFKGCKQGKRFIQYVVEQTLHGNGSLLKERLLGTALFDRAPDYATGEDSVVRVQANDVRRRLNAYRAECTHPPAVEIELPVGSYIPIFRTLIPEPTGHSARLSVDASDANEVRPIPGNTLRSDLIGHDSTHSKLTVSTTESPVNSRRRWRVLLIFAAIVIGCISFAVHYRSRITAAEAAAPERLGQVFWQPVISSPNPAVICLGKTVVYRPSESLFRRYGRSHPGEFLTDNEKLTGSLPLNPRFPLQWRDLDEATNYGFTIGSVRSAIQVASYLAQQRKDYGVRLGIESSFAELRNSPAILVGAFNNRWTLELTSGLHFTFVESAGQLSIREQGPSGRWWTWQFGPSGGVQRDYGLVTRQTVSKTGQSVISVGGIGDGGTEAASEVVTKPGELADVLKQLPSGWEKKNVQLVVATDITDGEASRPRLVTYYVW
jgi:hypothetical protein